MNTERTSARKRWLIFLVPCFALWALTFVAATGGLHALHGLTGALRIVASGLLVGAWCLILRHGPRCLLVMPLTHLAAFALLFYGWMPSMSVLIMEINPDGLYAARGNNYGFIASYVGGRSELLVIGFAALCLAGFATVAAILSSCRRA